MLFLATGKKGGKPRRRSVPDDRTGDPRKAENKSKQKGYG